MIRDALTDSFNTRSIAENQIVLQKLVAIYSLVYKIVEKIGNRKEEKQKLFGIRTQPTINRYSTDDGRDVCDRLDTVYEINILTYKEE